MYDVTECCAYGTILVDPGPKAGLTSQYAGYDRCLGGSADACIVCSWCVKLAVNNNENTPLGLNLNKLVTRTELTHFPYILPSDTV